jgi:ABC-type glycerol-3-phosphate transport system permease component
MSQKKISEIIIYIILFIGAMVVLFPFIWMVLTALKPPHEALAYPPIFFPKNPTLDNFIKVFTQVPFSRYLLNSIYVSTVITVSTLFFCSLGGYVFAKHKFPLRDFIFLGVIAKLMIPNQVQLIPMYFITQRLHLIDNLWGIIVPGLMGAFGIFFMRQFFFGVPDSLLEAGKIDGLSEFGLYFKIALPLCKPALATLAIITFIYAWDDFMWPLIIINSQENMTLPLGLAVFEGHYFAQYGLTMAAATVSILPMLIVYLFMQKQIIESMAYTGIKE